MLASGFWFSGPSTHEAGHCLGLEETGPTPGFLPVVPGCFAGLASLRCCLASPQPLCDPRPAPIGALLPSMSSAMAEQCTPQMRSLWALVPASLSSSLGTRPCVVSLMAPPSAGPQRTFHLPVPWWLIGWRPGLLPPVTLSPRQPQWPAQLLRDMRLPGQATWMQPTSPSWEPQGTPTLEGSALLLDSAVGCVEMRLSCLWVTETPVLGTGSVHSRHAK